MLTIKKSENTAGSIALENSNINNWTENTNNLSKVRIFNL